MAKFAATPAISSEHERLCPGSRLKAVTYISGDRNAAVTTVNALKATIADGNADTKASELSEPASSKLGAAVGSQTPVADGSQAPVPWSLAMLGSAHQSFSPERFIQRTYTAEAKERLTRPIAVTIP